MNDRTNNLDAIIALNQTSNQVLIASYGGF